MLLPLSSQGTRKGNLQFQQCQVRIAVVCPILALLRHVVLKYRGCFRVISVEAVEDGVDVFGAVRGVVECDSHVWRQRRVFWFVEGGRGSVKSFKCGRIPRLAAETCWRSVLYGVMGHESSSKITDCSQLQACYVEHIRR